MAKLIKGVNSLDVTHPQIAAEWDYIKNYPLRPEDVTSGSGKKVWWICPKEKHSYQAIIGNRTTRNKTKCPYCSGRRATKETCLETQYPELIKLWSPRNFPLLPRDVTTKSHKKVWWICENGHEYQASIYSKVSGNGCPYCSMKRPIVGETDLGTLYKNLKKEWHPTKNVPLTPEDVTPRSGRKVWWLCEKGHEYQAVIYDRAMRGDGCPYCSHQRLDVGKTDLGTLYKNLKKEWHPTKNFPLTPETVAPNSHRKVWWVCEKGHEYQAAIHNRVKGRGCPYCSHQRPIVGETDLGTLYKNLKKEWHPTKNYPLVPEDVTPGSGKKVWWMCEKGHEYQAVIHSRVKGTNCPYCSGRRPKEDESLAHIYPEVCKNWDYEKNKKSPDEYGPSSTRYAYWKCHICGESYKRKICLEVKATGCKKCKK